MTVADLINKLSAIEDQEIGVVFFCPKCDKYVSIDDMKCFGFEVPIAFRFPVRKDEECGYCGGTGEVACSSTSYMSCPKCSRKGVVSEENQM